MDMIVMEDLSKFGMMFAGLTKNGHVSNGVLRILSEGMGKRLLRHILL